MRYFLNVCDSHEAVEDRVGSDYTGDRQAREAAVDAAREFLAEGDAKGECRRHWHFDVLDEYRRPLFRLPFSHAIEPGTLPASNAEC